MTITSVDITQEGSSLASTGSDGATVKRTFTSHYRVITDNATTSTKVIEKHFETTPTLPWFGRSWKWTGENGAPNDKDPDAICKRIQVNHQPNSCGVFTVEATYEPKDGDSQTEKPNNSDGKDTSDPLEWRESMVISYTQVTEPVMWAIFRGFTTGEMADQPYVGTNKLRYGNTYVPQNSALVPFDPLPEKEIDLKVIRMTKNIAQFNSNNYDPWISTVNADNVHIVKLNLGMEVHIPPLKGRIKGISASSDFQNGVAFVRREVEIWVHPNGWRGRLADMGHEVLPLKTTDTGFVSPGDLINIPAQSEHKTVRDGDGMPSTAPKLLDGFGRLRRSDDPAKNVWSNWQYYGERPWMGVVNIW